jgi:CheY-like chemotaxis protein
MGFLQKKQSGDMHVLRPRILVVDNDADNREMLPLWLDRGQGRYEVITAASGREARELIVQRRFDVYILDYRMPEMTGSEFCATLRELDPNGAVIVYSAMSSPSVRAECAAAGADLFLLKPDDMDLIIPSVDELLEQRRRKFMMSPTEDPHSQPTNL